jgi:hypothetical protein
LEVLNQRELEMLMVGELPDDGRNTLEASHSSGPETSLTGHEAVAVECLGDDDRLEHAVLGDAGREGFEL